jgi:spermidine synthase
MPILARFAGPNGEISVVEERSTGGRRYYEGGVEQSYVLAGGEAGVAYICLMSALLDNGANVLLLGCAGGALAGMLHRRGRSVAVVDTNPISFDLARAFFWMPDGIECITRDMREFVHTETRTFDAIGVDVGGPCFSYETVLEAATVASVRRLLCDRGRIAINISCGGSDDPVPGRIADTLKAEGLNVWMFRENEEVNEINVVILATVHIEEPSALVGFAQQNWSLARLAT